jgi:sugar lactone lactonase YvrE
MSPAQNRPVASTSTEVVEKVAGDFTRSEGPVWVRQGYLLFSDFEQSHIFRLTPPNEVTVYLDRIGAANGRMRSGGEVSRFAESLSNTLEST